MKDNVYVDNYVLNGSKKVKQATIKVNNSGYDYIHSHSYMPRVDIDLNLRTVTIKDFTRIKLEDFKDAVALIEEIINE